MPESFNDLTQLYKATLRQVCFKYEYYNSPRGHSEYEIIGYNVRLNNPTARFCLNTERRQNIVFNYAEALWYLSGKNDVDFIAYYAPSMKRYSPDGKSLPGTGYGARLRYYGANALDQIERAIDILKNDDADSKRVVLQIFSAEEDLFRRNIDVSCTLGLQLLLRDGKLNMVGFMRANDAYTGLLNDIFSFTFLQEYIASRIGCEIGHYTHQVGSLHVYDDTLKRALTVLNNQETLRQNISIPTMPLGTSSETISSVLSFEAQIRKGQVSLDDLLNIHLSPYWRDILLLFWIYRHIKMGEQLPRKAMESINQYYRPFIINRWDSTTDY
ncbi:thymidylate synthase [Brenneria uluponensis]|uniref:thymidylate synthase n=1 Tax=Brenneria uluponensis TaxID=3057057 RepID=UPI0028E2ED95|nr:thymidylate synthase [Brenneria ulupoensis]